MSFELERLSRRQGQASSGARDRQSGSRTSSTCPTCGRRKRSASATRSRSPSLSSGTSPSRCSSGRPRGCRMCPCIQQMIDVYERVQRSGARGHEGSGGRNLELRCDRRPSSRRRSICTASKDSWRNRRRDDAPSESRHHRPLHPDACDLRVTLKSYRGTDRAWRDPAHQRPAVSALTNTTIYGSRVRGGASRLREQARFSESDGRVRT